MNQAAGTAVDTAAADDHVPLLLYGHVLHVTRKAGTLLAIVTLLLLDHF